MQQYRIGMVAAEFNFEVTSLMIERAKAEVLKRNGGSYTCPLPDSVAPPLDTY